MDLGDHVGVMVFEDRCWVEVERFLEVNGDVGSKVEVYLQP
jgi:hypothetical protein